MHLHLHIAIVPSDFDALPYMCRRAATSPSSTDLAPNSRVLMFVSGRRVVVDAYFDLHLAFGIVELLALDDPLARPTATQTVGMEGS